jgi:hypothetical protein
LKPFLNFLRRIPFTLIMLTGLALGGLVTNTYFQAITRHWLNRTGFATRDLWYLRLGRMFTSALVTNGGRVFWEAILLVAIFVGVVEWINGWKRAAATFWGVHLLTLVLLALIITLSLHQLHTLGIEASEVARDVGPSAGYFACLGFLSARLKHPWNWFSGGILFLFFIVALLLPVTARVNPRQEVSANLAHLLAFPLGWLSSRLGSKQ